MNRERYHPIPIGSDLLRYNNFDFIVNGQDPIKLMCKSAQFITPKTTSVAVPWASGTMSLAGRTTSAYSFTITCLVGLESQYNAWQTLYEWRKRVFDHDSGRIALASEYKEEGNILIYDITADTQKVNLKISGMWPTEVSDLTFTVDSDAIVEVTAIFFADKILIESFS